MELSFGLNSTVTKPNELIATDFNSVWFYILSEIDSSEIDGMGRFGNGTFMLMKKVRSTSAELVKFTRIV